MTSSPTDNPSSFREVLFNLKRRSFYPFQKTKWYWLCNIAVLAVYLILYYRFVISYFNKGHPGGWNPLLFFLIVFGVPSIVSKTVDFIFYKAATRKK